MNKVLRIARAALLAVTLIAIANSSVKAQCLSSWNSWANSGGNYAPPCSNTTLGVPSTGYTYFNLTAGANYTFSLASGGTVWGLGYYIEYYIWNGSSWVCQVGAYNSITFQAGFPSGGNGTGHLIVCRNGQNTVAGLPGTTWPGGNSATLTYRTNNAVLGTQSTSGPIDFCASNGNFGTAVTVSGGTGRTVFNWGSSNGTWSGYWTYDQSGVSTFPPKTAPVDGVADRIRQRKIGGACGDAVGAAILIRNRYAPTPSIALTGTTSPQCSNGLSANITLRATFSQAPSNFGTLEWYSGSCGTGTLVGTTNLSGTTTTTTYDLTIPNPGATTTYYVRYNPNSGSGGCTPLCSGGITFTVNTAMSVSAITATPATSPACGQSLPQLSVTIGGTSATTTWWSGSGGTGTNFGTGNTLNPGLAGTYYARVTGASPCAAVQAGPYNLSLETTNPSLSVPSNISLNNSPNNLCKGAGMFDNPGLTDNCSNGSSAQMDVVSGISGLTLWTRADAGVVKDAAGNVSQWRDLSGNNNHFTQSAPGNRPTLTSSNANFNGRPSLTFNTSQYMTNLTNIGGGGNVAYTMFTVSRLSGGTNARLLSSASTNWLLGYWGGYVDRAYTNNWIAGSSTSVNSVAHMYSISSSGTGGNGTVFYDYGNVIATGTAGTPNAPGVIQLNGYSGGLNEMSNGEVCEVIYYNRVLTNSERQLVEGYLAFKYNLSSPIVSHQAYQTYSNGNTRTFQAADAAGNRASSSAPSVALTSYPAPLVTNPATPACNSMTFTTSSMAPAGKKLTATGNNWLCVGGGTCANPGTSNLALGSNWTIETWYNASTLPANAGGWNTLVRGTANHHIIISKQAGTSGEIGVYNGGFYSSGFNIVSNIASGWHHIAAVGSGGKTAFYVDGVKVGIANSQAIDNVVAVGNYQGGGQAFGEIDEVRIWNVALPQNTISNYMTQGITSGHPNWNSMVAYFKMDGAGTNSATGSAACGSCTATLQGANWSSDVNFYTYTWTVSSGSVTPALTTTAESITVTNAAQGTFSYSVYAAANSCNSQTRTGSVVVPFVGVPVVGGDTVDFSMSACGSGTINATPGTGGTTCRFWLNSVGGVLLGSGSAYNTNSNPLTQNPGTYDIVVETYNATTGCSSASTVKVTITITTPFSGSLTTSAYNGYGVSCNGGSNGALTISVGTTAYPIQYAWSTGAVNTVNAQSNTITGLQAGAYSVTATDAGGCAASFTATLTQPPALALSFTNSNYNGFNVSCNGSSDGTSTVTPTGGPNATYSYAWSTGVLTNQITARSAGTYQVTVTDANSCTIVGSTTLSEPSAVGFTYSVGYVCSGNSYVSATVTIIASGGTGSYTYSSNGGGAYQGSNEFLGLANNSTVILKVKDSNGCESASQSVTINFPPNGQAVGDCGYIYVAPYGDPNGTLGTKACPVQSIVQAISIYNGNPSRNHVLVLGGSYTISQKVVVPAGITIDGSYSVSGSDWVKNTAAPSTITINPPLETQTVSGNLVGHHIGIEPSGNNFILKDLNISVLPSGASGTTNNRGRSVYGVYLNGRTGYTISRCNITTGAASAGVAGVYNGTAGGGASGGSGGTNPCIGSAAGCEATGCNGGAGYTGSNGSGGAGGGSGGGGGAGCTSSDCNWFGCDAESCTASNGYPGGAGNNGGGMSQATATVSTNYFLPVNGSVGYSGAGGGGGGSGGNGAMGTDCTCSQGGDSKGGDGGAGGAGGGGGAGGNGGGGSFAVYAWGGSGTLVDCSLTSGSGGGGGAGAVGRPGVDGANGAAGHSSTGSCSPKAIGGTGGKGGKGGTGGTGQQGANGVSQVLVQLNGASVTQSGTSIPNNGQVTANVYRGCTNSEIILTKTTGSWSVSSNPTFTNNLTSSTSSYNNGQNTISVYYTTTGTKDIVVAGVTLRNFIQIYNSRTLPTIDVSGIPATVCPNTSIAIGTAYTADQYEWQIANKATPSSPVASSSSQNPGTINPPFGGWVQGATYQVRLRVYENCCGWSIPVYAEFTVASVPAQPSVITPNTFACANSTVSYAVTNVSGVTYTWSVTGGTIQSGQGSNSISVKWGGAGTGNLSVTPSNTCGNGTARTQSISINGQPNVVITANPGLAICSGGSTTLTASTTSGGGVGNGSFSYLWSNAAVSASITVSAFQTYQVTVTEGGSGCSAIQTATVSQTPSPSISTHPINSTVCEQTNTSFTVVASGAGLTYQWQVSTNGGGLWNDITAAGSNPTYAGFNSSATLNVNGVTNANNGWMYRVVVSGTCVPGVTSNGATLNVNAAPSVTTNPQASTICNGDNTSFSVVASGYGTLSYQWQVNDGLGWSNITAAGSNPTYGGFNSSSTLTLTGTPTSVNGYNYRVVVSGGCAPAATTVAALLTVNPTSVGGIAGTSGNGPTICTGQSTTLLLGGNTGSVQWQDSPDGSTWTNIPGATSTSYNTPALTADRYYRAIVTSGVCPSATSTVQMIDVKNSVAGTASANQGICTGSQPADITLSGSNGNIQWQQADDAGFTVGLINIPGGTSSTLTGALVGTLTSTKYFRAQVTDWPCGSAISNTVVVTVSPQTVAGSVTGGTTPLCLGSNTGTLTLSGNTGAVVKWQKQLNGGGWSDIADTNTTYSEVPTSTGTWDYRAVVQSGACAAGNSGYTTVVVNSAPAITILPEGNDSVGCNNDVFVLNTSISGGGSGTITYQWAIFDYGTSTYSNISGAINDSLHTAPLTNPDNTLDKLYKFKVTYNRSGSGCAAASDEVELTILPTPSLTSTMEDCAGTVGGGEWDYIYTSASGGAPTYVVNDISGGAANIYASAGDVLKIYRTPMGAGTHTFEVTDANGCKATSTLGKNTGLPTTLPNVLVAGNAQSQCILKGFDEWVHFRKQGSASEVIASVKDNGVDLGTVTVTSYREATSPTVPNSGAVCVGTPIAAMRRHFVVKSGSYPDPSTKFQDGNANPTDVSLRLYFSQADFDTLVANAAANNVNGNHCTEDDDITSMNALYLTKYSDYALLGNEDGDYLNNSTNSAYYRVFNVGNLTNPLAIQQNGFD
ncbi:MAG: hypothetical protein KF872_10450, partial [Chitinophagales bacterium]|nr:hypothetical protein [Chitinophagales bacterium]